MKKSLYIMAAAALSLTMSSCEEDFLETKPSERTSPEQIADAAKLDPTLLNGFVAGLYTTMFNTGTGGTTNHDDFGQKGYDIFSDMIASDVVLAGTTYGWYSGIARYQATTDFTLNAGYQPWRYYYRIVFAANTLIEILGGNDAVPEKAINKHQMGQAKAMRAYAHFYLSQYFSNGYGTGNEKTIPIYSSSASDAQPRSTSAEVYNFIVKDLTEAVTLLEGFNRSAKNEINQDVAKGLLAYAYASRGSQADLQQVIELTDELIGGNFRLLNPNEVVAQLGANGEVLNPESGFNNVASPSWMWGVDLTVPNGLDLVSYWGQMDIFTYSYAWAGDPKTIDVGLYNAIREDDVRKGQFDPINGGIEAFYKEDGYGAGDMDLMPVNKFFDPNRVIGGQRVVVTDYVYMRLEEMVLLNAEAKARLGQDGPARDMLKTLMVKRIVPASYAAYESQLDGLSGQALLDEIYLQTRIELWGEGKTYLAMKRLKKSVTRGSNHLFFQGQTYAWDSDELTFNIPQNEVVNNPVLNQ
ncbi:RagB/SusD family nutrient uptake outer membrane protein [Rufibacter latericius]|uniref:RagB/SusD family nutrient uptake outer membrane protein n=1 Tax=Rufibacter latericius TaxID=2487040 RepID=A0A3M9MND4_9BACT|nr:RagB/SusD family nutrient uptake outer membrane protein [Rufibacter latericius]RNI26188.1 RagB/SusD family nutrient uptake outer membrane protein [Rufibacter latericius]